MIIRLSNFVVVVCFSYHPGPSFSRMFSRTPASRQAAQCCDAFKAEVSFWCYPRLAIRLSRWRAFEFSPSPITESEKSIFQIFFEKPFLHNPSTYNGIDKQHFYRSPKNIFSNLQIPLYLSKGHEKGGCPKKKIFLCKIYRKNCSKRQKTSEPYRLRGHALSCLPSWDDENHRVYNRGKFADGHYNNGACTKKMLAPLNSDIKFIPILFYILIAFMS